MAAHASRSSAPARGACEPSQSEPDLAIREAPRALAGCGQKGVALAVALEGGAAAVPFGAASVPERAQQAPNGTTTVSVKP